MARTATMQMMFPRFESDGVTHTSDCSCPRCTAYRPRGATDEELDKAHVALERMKEKKRIRALKMELALAESERQTRALLEQQRRAHERVAQDERLEELLRLRQAGVSPAEALAQIESGAERRPARPIRTPLPLGFGES